MPTSLFPAMDLSERICYFKERAASPNLPEPIYWISLCVRGECWISCVAVCAQMLVSASDSECLVN